MSLITSAFDLIFALLTDLVFGLFCIVYTLLYNIANTTIAEDSMNIIANNVYAILGVLMLFKFAFSLVQYIIDPDKFGNKETGFGAIVKNSFIVLALILLVPLIFDQAMKLQRIILNEDIIGRVITGHTGSNYLSNTSNFGETMAFNLASGFVRPNTADCKGVVSMVPEDRYKKCLASIPSGAAKTDYETAMKNNSFSDLLTWNIITARYKNSSGKTVRTFNFDGLTAILVGGFVTYVLLIFCMDIATRAVKLSFLRIISPIPIVSYIDPASKKKSFDGWVKECLSTYADLFVRLGAVDFAVYLIQIIISGGFETTISDANGFDVTSEPGIFVKIFLIIGILMFAKQLPKLMESVLGIKLSGNFTLNPYKKIENEALFGKQAASVVRTGVNTAGNLAGFAYQNSLGRVVNPLGRGIHSLAQRAGNAIGGSAFGTAVGGAASAISGAALGSPGGKYLRRIGADTSALFGGLTKPLTDRRVNELKNITNAVDAMEKRAKDKIVGKEAGILSQQYLARENLVNDLKSDDSAKRVAAMNQARANFQIAEGRVWSGTDAELIAWQEMNNNEWLNNTAVYDYIDTNGSNTQHARDIFGTETNGSAKSDGTLTGSYEDYQTSVNLAGEEIVTTASARHSSASRYKQQINDTNRRNLGTPSGGSN